MSQFKRTFTGVDIIEKLERRASAQRLLFFITSILLFVLFFLSAYAMQYIKKQYVSEIGIVFDIVTALFIAIPIVYTVYEGVDCIRTFNDLKNQSFIVSQDRLVDKYTDKYNPFHKFNGRLKYESGFVFQDHGRYLADKKTVDEAVISDCYFVVSYSFKKNKAELVFSTKDYNYITKR